MIVLLCNTKITKNKEFLHFCNKNKDNLKNPIIKNFLRKEKNLNLLMKAVLHPSKYNKEAVDKAFRSYYLKVKKIKYVSNLIYFFSIDFDKKQRKHQNNQSLILDKNITNEAETTFKELIPDKKQSTDNIFGSSLIDHIEDKRLAKALKKLTEKQLQVLELIYLKNVSLKEISFILDSTPQNVSNQHRKALIKLYDLLKL